MSVLPPQIMDRVKADLGLVALADATAADLSANARITSQRQALNGPPQSCAWFVPIVDHVLKGGVRTIFSVAERMSEAWGTSSVFVVYSFSGRDFDLTALDEQLRTHFPKLKFTTLKFRRGVESIEAVPACDIALCTLWTTAYLLLKYNATKRKFYFLQDYEPVFYAGGSVYGVIEATYRFGFSGIANTLGVAQRYRRYQNDVMSFTPGIDRSIFFADEQKSPADAVKRVVFYGRPQNDRNAFALGIETLRALKQFMGDRVEIISVGAAWNESDFGVQGVVRNDGLLPGLQLVADLYRSAHVGLVFMFSAHPSYQPLEYMACGCVPATNINENNEWLLRHDMNCLFMNPAPHAMAQEVAGLLDSPARWTRLRAHGLKTVQELNWEAAYSQILEFVSGDDAR